MIASICPPSTQIRSVSPATTPSLMMSALSVGRDRAAIVSTTLRARTASSEGQYGLR